MGLREVMKNRGLTQSELAAHLGKSQRLISLWVNGGCQPQLEMVPKLAEIFGVTEREVIDWFTK